jgi:hypothetical protein
MILCPPYWSRQINPSFHIAWFTLVIFRLVFLGCKVNKPQGLNLAKTKRRDTMPLVTGPQSLRAFSKALMMKSANCRKWEGYIDFNIS